MVARLVLAALFTAAQLAVAIPAMAYDETGLSADPSDCESCHDASTVLVGGTGAERQGPHGEYTATSSKCGGCHWPHAASPDIPALLPGPTITESCELCHDGTGGHGVYGAIAARGLTVASTHRTEVTSLIPGGDPSTGDESTATFSGLGGSLSCVDCHSPHGLNVVQEFTSDRRRIETDTAGFLSNKLLRQRPTGVTTPTAVFGSDWCGGCHAGRSAGAHEVMNHPVETSATSGFFTYEDLQVVDGTNSSNTETGTLGGSNFGYVMPWPRTAGQGTHVPICQQCHEDARNVGDGAVGQVRTVEVFKITGADGSVASDNPRLQTSPHESVNPRLLVEVDDDLCTNCHTKKQLK